MIDWFSLAANSLWILACAIALATLSHASWAGSLRHEKLDKILALPNYQTSLNIAGILFCLGLAGTSHKLWESVLWLILMELFVALSIIELIRKRKK
jgi:apolipoprotein N-acyltransferase